jgi:6,7-dimethyl-8-ribityllumazine synthase
MASTGNLNLFQLDAGILSKDACIVMIKTAWNAAITDELENGCRRVFRQNNIDQLETITVPGAVEITFAIKAYWDAKKYLDTRPHAFVALGCVIKGDTPHFEYVCKAVTDGVVALNLNLPVPVIFGVLTVNNEEQALERIGGKHGHKGEEAAITALKMISLQQSFKQ